MLRKILLFSSLFFIFLKPVLAQDYELDSLKSNMSEIQQYLFLKQHDSTYISNYNDKLAIKLIANTKLNFFQLRDKEADESIFYRPNRGLNLGVGASYRWFALEMVFSSSIEEDTELKDNRFLDFQGRVYSNKHFIETKLQYYDGYQMHDAGSSFYQRDGTNVIRDDVRTVSMGLQYLFAFNYKHFSFKAPFVLTEIQRKSAGSVIAGMGFNMFMVNADSSVLPSSEESNMSDKLAYKDMLVLDLSFKFGYMYSFVVHENYFLSLGAIPGIGYSIGDYTVDDRQKLDPQFTWNVKGLATLGFTDKRVFSGLQVIFDLNSVKHGSASSTLIGNGKISCFVGYRFNVQK